jgi:hypothetical protein
MRIVCLFACFALTLCGLLCWVGAAISLISALGHRQPGVGLFDNRLWFSSAGTSCFREILRRCKHRRLWGVRTVRRLGTGRARDVIMPPA